MNIFRACQISGKALLRLLDFLIVVFCSAVTVLHTFDFERLAEPTNDLFTAMSI